MHVTPWKFFIKLDDTPKCEAVLLAYSRHQFPKLLVRFQLVSAILSEVLNVF